MRTPLTAVDLSREIIDVARQHYGDRVAIRVFGAQDMPFNDHPYDVVILFEAIHYLPSARRFVDACKRVLFPGGDGSDARQDDPEKSR